MGAIWTLWDLWGLRGLEMGGHFGFFGDSEAWRLRGLEMGGLLEEERGGENPTDKPKS